MKLFNSLLLALFVSAGWATAESQTYSVWAPGVSEEGGWFDFNKTRGGAYYNDDSGMCWAASAANVIAWWQQQMKVQNTDMLMKIPQGQDVWKTFVTVFENAGGHPSSAFKWWIDGSVTPAHKTNFDKDDKVEWIGIDGQPYYPTQYGQGGILSSPDYTPSPLYSLSANPLTIVAPTGQSYDIYDYSRKVVDALRDGYALTLCVREGADHAFTLWGVDYQIVDQDKYLLTKIWVTDSNDTKAGSDVALITYYEVVANESALRFDYGGDYGLFCMEQIHGMRVDIVPEPATATLSLLALVGLAARRRRR